MKKMILINTSNLHYGGGVQVAVSFIYELSIMKDRDHSSLSIFSSTEVNNELCRLGANLAVFGSYEVVDSFGLKAYFSKLNNRIKEYDLVFTVFGPNYLRVKAEYEVVGFAQSWMLNFNNPISEKMSFLSRNILRAKFYIQWIFFLRVDHYIVELEHVKKELTTKKGVDYKKVTVVHNTVSSLYIDESKWKSISVLGNNFLRSSREAIVLGVVTRDYPHKNLIILPAVAEVLESKHNLIVNFYVTLNKVEWATKDNRFKKYVSTIGSLSPDQCPLFYEQLDGVIFPSLLECFSATPLEAMVMRKPLFASDRDFVRDVCSGYAIYFDPLDIDDIALNIANYFRTDKNHSEYIDEARNHALNFSSAKERAEKYLEIIQQRLES